MGRNMIPNFQDDFHLHTVLLKQRLLELSPQAGPRLRQEILKSLQ